jgi:tRNA(fMet)-specific endonuclease VapC
MPANGNVLLDSSVVIPYFKRDAAIRQQIQGCSALYLPTTVLGELYCGANLSINPTKVLAEIQNLLIAMVLLPIGAITAEHYGQIRAALAKSGTPIPENDIWIAATAQEYQLPVATRDEHFGRISGLQILKW